MLSNSCSRVANPQTMRRCEGQMEFFGISTQKIKLPQFPRAITVHFRWQQCTACGQYRQETFTGIPVAILDKMTDKQIETLFPTEEIKHGRNAKPKRGTGKTKSGLPGRIGAQPNQP